MFSAHLLMVSNFYLPTKLIKFLCFNRYRKYNATDMPRATEYLLSDFDDDSEYESAQMFKSNAINPCINSTYTFIRHLMKEVKLLHQV